MSAARSGSSVVFLVSLPRSGSTLLQRMIGSHKTVATSSEPWLALHPLHGLRFGERTASYDVSTEKVALESVLAKLPHGKASYFEAAGLMLDQLYGDLRHDDHGLFLDKTPRYHLILNELATALPGARFLILLRHPAAVLTSMITTWGVDILHRYAIDLLEGPRNLLNGVEALAERCLVVRYEDLLADWTEVLQEVFHFLEIPFDARMITLEEGERWVLGDQGTVYEHSAPVAEHARAWVQASSNPVIWRAVREYALLLGPATFADLGYSFEDTLRALAEREPPPAARRLGVPLRRLLRPPATKGYLRYFRSATAQRLVR